MFEIFLYHRKYKITKLTEAIISPLKWDCIERFQLSVNSNLRLLKQCFTMLCDW